MAGVAGGAERQDFVRHSLARADVRRSRAEQTAFAVLIPAFAGIRRGRNGE